MADNQYTVIAWPRLLKYLKERQAQVDRRLRRASGEERDQLQGQARLLEELENLPEALQLEDQEDAHG